MEERTGSVGKIVDGGAVPCGSGGEWIVSDDLVLEGRELLICSSYWMHRASRGFKER